MDIILRRGINIGGWISQSRLTPEERKTYFNSRDINLIRTRGFDHIRLPIDEGTLWDDAGVRIDENWAHLNSAIDWSLEAGMPVVVDLHILRSHYFNAVERPLFSDPAAPERFARVWRELSAELRGRPTSMVAYELMNEPVADDPEDWNRVYQYPYRAIREEEPERIVVLGCNRWSSALVFDTLRIPENDPNILLTFHYYNSMFLTHYKAAFVNACAAYEGPIQYPGRPIPEEVWATLPTDYRAETADWNRHYDASVMERELALPLAARERTGLPLYCGEFGIIANAPDQIRRDWARDFRSVLEKLDIGWAAWSYKQRSNSGFHVFDTDGNPSPVYEGLFGQS